MREGERQRGRVVESGRDRGEECERGGETEGRGVRERERQRGRL